MPKNSNKIYYLYLLECGDKTLYTGITTDVERRFEEHNLGKGGAYTRSRKVKKVLYTEQFKNRSEASKREAEIKGWKRREKLDFIRKKELNLTKIKRLNHDLAV